MVCATISGDCARDSELFAVAKIEWSLQRAAGDAPFRDDVPQCLELSAVSSTCGGRLSCKHTSVLVDRTEPDCDCDPR